MKSKNFISIIFLLLASNNLNEANGVQLHSQELLLAQSTHRTSSHQRQKHGSQQKQKTKKVSHVGSQEEDAEETLSSVEIADIQTDNAINAEDGDAEQKRQDKAKFDEVMSLMNKYDQAEAHIKWVNSAEYAQQKENLRIESIKQQEQEKLKQKEQEVLEQQQKEEEEKEKQQSLIQQEEDLRHNQEYVKKCVSRYTQAFSESDGRRILTKDKAYLAAGDIVSKVRKIRGVDQQKFLDTYFKTVWDNHDEQHNNLIEENDVEEFFNDILSSGTPQNKQEDD